MEEIAIAVLVTITFLVLGYAFVLPYFSGELKAESRVGQQIKSADEKRAEIAKKTTNMRRGKLDEVLKEIDKSEKNIKNPPLSVRLSQAGLDWSKQKFIGISFAIGVGCFVFTLINGQPIYVAGAAGIVSGLGTPRFILNFLKKRRIQAFTEELPNAIDIIVRGVKAGLPINDSIRIVANEAKEPVRGEFLYLVELQQMGFALSDAVVKLPERMPIPEANFFAIAIVIQQKAGGSISEILSNLSKVLRERKKLKNKIQAMSQEAKASAMIIASLPILLAGFLMISSPQHMNTMFATQTGNLMLVGCGLLMAFGVFIMHKMINIEV